MKSRTLVLATFIFILSVVSTAPYAVSPAQASPTNQSDNAIITLPALPLSSYDGRLPGYAATAPTRGEKLDLNSPAAHAYSSYLSQQRDYAKAWLASLAPQVQITYEYSIVLNGLAVKLNGYPLTHLTALPGIASADFSYNVHYDMNRSPTLIGAPTLWTSVGGQSKAGAGIKIGIIDTGIDQTHPFLTDNSLAIPKGYPKCDALDSVVGKADTACKYTSNKVLVAKMFCTQPVCSTFDAHAAQDHGSHVSGIAAGVANTCAPFVGCTLSGIAPKAYLGNYNVFPGNVTDATSVDIAMAVEAAVMDKMDVLNLSLGGTAVARDPLVDAVNNAVDAGVVVAIAAGNSGPAPGTVESPGIAEKVITVGASTNPHFIGISVTSPNVGSFGAALGEFNNFGQVSNVPYATTTEATACNPISQNLSGQIALIQRGTCTFTTKIRNAQNAFAMGVLIYNNAAGDPIAMAHDGTNPFPTVPAAMVSLNNGNAMVSNVQKTVSIDGTQPQEFYTDGPSADILARFSSRGPAMIGKKILSEVKPDVVAPGVNVYSSILSTSCATPPCYAFFQGTSMATPHVAGSAAVLKQLHPNWSPVQIKSALTNTAKRPVGSSATALPIANPMDRGGGRIDLAAASQFTATISISGTTSSISFGELHGTQSSTQTVSVTSIVKHTITYTITIAQAVSGPAITTSTGPLTIGRGSSAAFDVSSAVSPSIPSGDYFGDIVLTGGTVTLSIPYWVRVP